MRPSRADVLAQLGPRGWFVDHVTQKGDSCGCTMEGSARTCDLGEALFRLRQSELARAPAKRR